MSGNQDRLEKCSWLMQAADLDALLLTKPANLFYLTGDGRLCAYAMITKAGSVALGVPSTDVEDVSRQAHFDHITSFEDEVGMIHAIAHHFEHFGIQQGAVGLEYTFLTQSMMGMLTHPHAKPAEVGAKDCTHILSELRLVKEPGEVNCIRESAQVAAAGMQIEVAIGTPIQEADRIAHVVEARIHPGKSSGYCFIHVDPERPAAERLPGSETLGEIE